LKEKHLYTFGEFSLNVEDHTLDRNGETIPITPKMFDLLLVFLENPGRVLKKDILLQTVWPDSFVEEGNITYNIRQLRRVMEDDAQSPKYIETIPRRGYRFLLPVDSFTTVTPDKEESSAIDRTAETPSPSTVPQSRPYVLIAVGALVILSGAVLIGGWLYKNRQPGGTPILSAPLSSEKLSTDGGVFHIAITPDGKTVVYTHRSTGKQSVWLRQIGNSNNVLLVPPSDDFYGGLAISPDGKDVYFARGSKQTTGLSVYRMPIYGGVPEKLIDLTQGWISISPDGSKISFVRCMYKDDDYCSLFIADSRDGKNEKTLVTRPRPFRIGDNEISPDGKQIAFAVGQSRTGSNDFTFNVVDIETGAEREITPQRFFNINYIVWLPNDSGFLMTALELPDKSYRIWSISASGETTKLTADSETYSRLGLDRSGSLLVSTQIEPDFRLMVFDAEHPETPPQPLADAASVTYAPDGKIYFSSLRTGDSEIWSIDPKSGEQKQLTSASGGDVAPIVSPDNLTVFFESARTGILQVWRMNIDGTDPRQVTTQEGGFPLRVSPDGRWVYYHSPLNNTIRRVSTETGEEELLMKEKSLTFALSPDVTQVAFADRQGKDTVISVYSVPEQTLLKSFTIPNEPYLAELRWSEDGSTLVYVITDDKGEGGIVWYQPLNGQARRKIVDLSGDEIYELAGFALSKDGKNFAVIKGKWKHNAVLFRGLK
jgi:DNA-binding winged helix-turn-helix (wHTH) protein/Tol biopolymer transport system component